jgi:hypothetical protein
MKANQFLLLVIAFSDAKMWVLIKNDEHRITLPEPVIIGDEA